MYLDHYRRAPARAGTSSAAVWTLLLGLLLGGAAGAGATYAWADGALGRRDAALRAARDAMRVDDALIKTYEERDRRFPPGR